MAVEELLAKQMPYSIEAEQAVLGSMLIDPQKVPDVVELLKSEDFYMESNRILYEAINRMILQTFDRGSTLYRTEGGFTRTASYAVQTIVDKRELFRLREQVLAIDSDAFIVVSQVAEVNGRGFTLGKIAGPHD